MTDNDNLLAYEDTKRQKGDSLTEQEYKRVRSKIRHTSLTMPQISALECVSLRLLRLVKQSDDYEEYQDKLNDPRVHEVGFYTPMDIAPGETIETRVTKDRVVNRTKGNELGRRLRRIFRHSCHR